MLGLWVWAELVTLGATATDQYEYIYT
jgi:hypothetical protein